MTVAWQLQRLKFDYGCGEKAKDGSWPCGKRRGGNCPDRHLVIPPHHEVKHIEGGLYLTRPKSRAGWRPVPIAPILREVLTRFLAANPPSKDGLIFHRPDGKPLDPSDDNEMWHHALAKAGLDPVPLHSARHTTATLLQSLGVPDLVRVRIMGHSSVSTTDIYTHISDPEIIEAMNRLGGLIEGGAPTQLAATLK